MAVSAALTLASGAALPAAHPSTALVPVLTVPTGEAVITADRLYVHRTEPFTDGSGTLTAYRLPDGTASWQRPVRAVAFTVVAGVPITVAVGAAGSAADAAIVPSRIISTALAPETGEPLWTREGGPAGEAAGGVLYLEQAAGPTGDETRVTAVDPRSGRQVWGAPVRGRLDWDRHRLVSLSTDGVLTTYDLGTGKQLASKRTAEAPGSRRDPGRPGRPAGGERVAALGTPVLLGPRVALVDYPTGELSAYDADTLAHLWSATMMGTHHLRRCDPLICLTTSGHIHAVDPVTGREAWPPVQAGPSSDRLPVDLPGAGHLLLGETSLGFSSVVVEVETGRARELTGWIISRRDGPPRPATQAPLLFRYDRVAHTTWVGLLDRKSLEVAVLGTIGDTLPAWCSVASPYLLCHLEDRPGQMRLWRAG